MGIPSDVMDVRASKRSSFMVAASPNEPRVIDSKTSPTQDAVQKGAKNGHYCRLCSHSTHEEGHHYFSKGKSALKTFSKKRKYCKRNDVGMYMNKKSHHAQNICSRIISKKALMYSDLMQSLLGKEAASIFAVRNLPQHH